MTGIAGKEGGGMNTGVKRRKKSQNAKMESGKMEKDKKIKKKKNKGTEQKNNKSDTPARIAIEVNRKKRAVTKISSISFSV